MKYLVFAICTAVLLVSTGAVGYLHGSMTNSWKLSPRSRVASQRLQSLPAKDFGNWRLVQENEFPPAVLSILEQPTYFSRTYQHSQTGDTISVAVLVGQPGPVSVHTPEICYSSRDYKVAGERQRHETVAADGRRHEFWKLSFDTNQADALPLDVMYGWSTGTVWEATEQPRYSFGGLSHLYKLQLAASVAERRDPDDFDPLQDFLAGFLRELQRQLVESSSRAETSE
jgi:hypothetical protein